MLVCKQWYEIAHITWSCKKRLIFDARNIYENYQPRSTNPYGFCSKPSKLNKLTLYDKSLYFSYYLHKKYSTIKLLNQF